MVKWKYIKSFTTYIYTFRVSKHIIGQSTNINVFSWLLSFFELRERVVYKLFGYKGKMSPKLLILFSTGFHWRIVLLLRANRLCSVFNTGLKDLESFVSQLIFCLQPGVKWLWSVCHEPCSETNILVLYFRWGEGSPTSVLGSQPIILLLSLSPSDVRRPEVTKYQHLFIPSVTHILS